MEGESFDGLGSHDIPFLRPFAAVLFCQLHKAWNAPSQVFGVEGRGHQLAHVQVVIKGEDSH